MNFNFINQFLPQNLPGELGIYSIIYNIPLFIFDFCLLVIFILLLRAVIIIIFSGKNELRIESGKRNFYATLFWLVMLLAGSFIFSSITKFLQSPVNANGEFPVLVSGDLPVAPSYYKIGNYYFAGPFALSEYNEIKKPAIYSIMCKDGDNYVIIALEKTDNDKLLESKAYSCWLNQCLNNSANIYIAFLYVPKGENGTSEKRDNIKTELDKQINSQCANIQ